MCPLRVEALCFSTWFTTFPAPPLLMVEVRIKIFPATVCVPRLSINSSTMSRAFHGHIVWGKMNFCCTNAPNDVGVFSASPSLCYHRKWEPHSDSLNSTLLSLFLIPKKPTGRLFPAEIQVAVPRWQCRNSQERTTQSLWSQSVWLTWGCTT